MKFIIIIFFCLLLFTNTFSKIAKIINGIDANIKDFPFMVSFRMATGNEHFCGGVIITQWHILTAAHCLSNRKKFYLSIKIHMGIDSAWKTSKTQNEISQVIIHPNFQTSTPNYGTVSDIAVVKVRNIIEFNEFQQKGTLSFVESQSGDDVMMIGWGLVDYPSTFYIEQLQKVSTKIITAEDCALRIQIPFLQEYICTYINPGVGGCIGDSGGPLISEGKIIGIFSFTTPCARGYPDVFVKIKPHLNFLTSAINNANATYNV